MLARTNFAATLASSQKEFLGASLTSEGQSPQALLAEMLTRVTPAPFDSAPQQALMSYLGAAGAAADDGTADKVRRRRRPRDQFDDIDFSDLRDPDSRPRDVDRQRGAAQHEGRRPCPPPHWLRRVSVRLEDSDYGRISTTLHT